MSMSLIKNETINQWWWRRLRNKGSILCAGYLKIKNTTENSQETVKQLKSEHFRHTYYK